VVDDEFDALIGAAKPAAASAAAPAKDEFEVLLDTQAKPAAQSAKD
jgi:hypothetical protein